MRKKQTKTYQDLLVAINTSKSERGFDRLLLAERLARQLLTNKHDASISRRFKNTVARLVRWLDEPFAQELAEELIMEYVRANTNDLSGKRGKRVENSPLQACPVCGMAFSIDDDKMGQKVDFQLPKQGGKIVARYRCEQCESVWEDTYEVRERKPAGQPARKVIVDGRF